MRKKLNRKILTLSISSMLLIGSSLTAMAAPSIGNLSSNGYVWGDGIRLRNEPWTGGTVLELMYNNEQVKYDPDYFDPNYDPELNNKLPMMYEKAEPHRLAMPAEMKFCLTF